MTGRGFSESLKKNKKQNKTGVTPEKNVMTSSTQTPGEYKFAPLVASQQGRADQHEPACFKLSLTWSFIFGIHYHVDLVSTDRKYRTLLTGLTRMCNAASGGEDVGSRDI